MRKLIFTLSAFLLFSTCIPLSSAAITIIPSANATEPDPATLKAAVEALKNMPRKERKGMLKMAKKEIKAFKAAKKAGKEPDTNTILLAILALFLPPLAVYLHQGEVNNKFWITLILFILGIAGGFYFSWLALLASIVYALLIILGNA